MTPRIIDTMTDYRKLSLDDLSRRVAELTSKAQELRSEQAIGKLTNHAQIKNIRRTIARLATVKREKIILQSLNG
ncbi:MAG: 50S ribosomal protein L29 [bacterium]